MNSAFSLPPVVPSRSRTFPSIKERTTIETIFGWKRHVRAGSNERKGTSSSRLDVNEFWESVNPNEWRKNRNEKLHYQATEWNVCSINISLLSNYGSRGPRVDYSTSHSAIFGAKGEVRWKANHFRSYVWLVCMWLCMRCVCHWIDVVLFHSISKNKRSRNQTQ